jgi:3-methyladenine DNA glycosylase AlkD
VGIQCKQFPEQVATHPGQWIHRDNFWLQRVSIIFQLTYRGSTDEGMLFQHILAVKDSKEFFLQKAAGWALRQYSKYKPQSVKKFLKANPDLPALTQREANKYL